MCAVTYGSLTPSFAYSFEVAACNTFGCSPYSEVMIFHTAPDVPDQITVFNAPFAKSTTWFELRWSPPFDNGMPIDYYTIHWRCSGPTPTTTESFPIYYDGNAHYGVNEFLCIYSTVRTRHGKRVLKHKDALVSSHS